MTRPAPIRVLLADDHPVVREGLAAILGRDPGIQVVAQAADGAEAYEAFRTLRPDVALIDLRMPVASGLQATRSICREFPGGRILILTTYDGDEDIFQALQAGASGYLLKDLPEAELVAAIRAVYAGRRVIPPSVAMRLAERFPNTALTDRETEVLGLIVGGRSNKEIGAALGIAEATVKSHVNKLLEKMGAADRTQAATSALRRGFFHFEDDPESINSKFEKSH
ncbi:MAG: response regulator transcription factor [Acidobacteriota bacterium]